MRELGVGEGGVVGVSCVSFQKDYVAVNLWRLYNFMDYKTSN